MADFNNLNNNNNMKKEDPSPASFMEIEGSEEDKILAKSEYLTGEEVVKRRLRQNKQLKRCYVDHYWALMEDLKVQYRKYYWTYGKSPYKEDEEIGEANGAGETIGEDHDNNGNNSSGNSKLGFDQCAMSGCKTKAMALTRFCHTHIMSDTKQMLYKRCSYVVKSAPTGPIICGKPILKSIVPANCPLHLQNAEKHVARALKKAGLNVSSSSKLAPKFHVMVVEYVRQIQIRRRAHKGTVDKVHSKEVDTKVQIKEEDTS